MTQMMAQTWDPWLYSHRAIRQLLTIPEATGYASLCRKLEKEWVIFSFNNQMSFRPFSCSWFWAGINQSPLDGFASCTFSPSLLHAARGLAPLMEDLFFCSKEMDNGAEMHIYDCTHTPLPHPLPYTQPQGGTIFLSQT